MLERTQAVQKALDATKPFTLEGDGDVRPRHFCPANGLARHGVLDKFRKMQALRTASVVIVGTMASREYVPSVLFPSEAGAPTSASDGRDGKGDCGANYT